MISLLLAVASLQAAPAPAPAANPIQAAAQAFGMCMEGKLATVPASVTPEAGVDDAFKQCEPQRASLETAIEGMIAAAPPEQQAMARQQLKDGMTRGRQKMIDELKAKRATPVN